MRYEQPSLDLEAFLNDCWHDAALYMSFRPMITGAGAAWYKLPYYFSYVLGFADFER